MNFLHCIFILLFPVIFSYPHWYSSDLNRLFNMYRKQQEKNYDQTNQKFGSPREYIFRPISSYYEQKPLQNPRCLPQVWTCGANLPPCCPGLMCYDGNAKRGRFCVARG
ncbi:unnamed protein product [Rotaria sordida]|uniref:Uncharacterized protein n=1 Tax=Rotaria sordida TaxID=392033 RepID=A0A814PH91_9BILA|nr:unnamed protein product [Rotaria sordida]CAF1105330.1 unnamed protein product [Rotaria sordida]CAF1106557.1 unnamed protein product [Rotaria sordida]CAF1218425.1 unnamed protein product [Rotaria sordida]CAF3957094.1 unnamed protein product [Rotaria sordida]